MDILGKIGLVMLGAAISVVGYFAKRWVEGKPHNETLDKHKKLLDIHKQIHEQWDSPDYTDTFTKHIVDFQIVLG